MVRHNAFRWTVAVLTLGWTWPVAADAIVSGGSTSSTGAETNASGYAGFVTGNVQTDMPSNSPSVTVIPGQQLGDVAQADYMTKAGLINGYVMKDIRLTYDQKSDTLAVGVNFWGTAGNTDGSPDGTTNPLTAVNHGSNPAHFGLDKSVTVAITPSTPAGANAPPLIVAGVPSDKTNAPTTTTDHFNVATYQASPFGLTYSYGQTLAGNLGNLAYDPSQAHPGFEFTIKNFSQIPGLNALKNGFYVSAYAGSEQTIIVGKSYIANYFVNPPQQTPSPQLDTPGVTIPDAPTMTIHQPPHTPEPATLLAWGLVAGAGALRLRRRLRRSSAL